MAKREFLQLAHNYKPAKHQIAGWFASEKLDGQRAFWDGGITRGMLSTEVPWANTAKDKQVNICTGLWSRYGKIIYAPDWWLDCMPQFALDGELYLGRNQFQELMSITRRSVNFGDWMDVKYYVFDSPEYNVIFSPGQINNTNYQKNMAECWPWAMTRVAQFNVRYYETLYKHLKRELVDNDVIRIHEQVQLPHQGKKARIAVEDMMADIVSSGGEGIILRHNSKLWVPERSYNILKVKPAFDAEATVVACTSGRETDKGSKHLGKMGALIVNFNGKEFELSGFTDEERELDENDVQQAIDNPGKRMPFCPKNFSVGQVITFTYRELTNDGIPKEARFQRNRQAV